MHSFQDARVTIGNEFAAAAADSATVGGTVIRRPGRSRARLPSGWTQSISSSSRPQVCGNEMEEESLPSGEEEDESLRTRLGAAHRLPALQGDSSEFSQQDYHGVPFAEQFSLVDATRPMPTMGRQSGGWAGNSASNTARLCGTVAVGGFVPPVAPRQHSPSPLGQGYHPTTNTSRGPGLNPRAPIYSATSGRLIPVEYPPVSSEAARAQYRANAGGSLRMIRQRPAALQLNISAARGYGQGQLPALASRPSSPLAADAVLEPSGSPQVPATPNNTAESTSKEASEAPSPSSLVDEVTKEDSQHGVFVNLPRDFDPWPRRAVVTHARTETSAVTSSGSTSTVGSQREGTNGRSSGNETNCDTANTEYFSAVSNGLSSPARSSIDATIDEESNVSEHMAALGDETPVEATAYDMMFSTLPTFTISPEQPFFDALSHPTDSPQPPNAAEIGQWATLIQPDQTENEGTASSPQHLEVPRITITEAKQSIDSSHQSSNAHIAGPSTIHPQRTSHRAYEASAVQQPVQDLLPRTHSVAIPSNMFLFPEIADTAQYPPINNEATFVHQPAVSMSILNPTQPAFQPSGLYPYDFVLSDMIGHAVPFIPPVAPQQGNQGMQGIQHGPANQSAPPQQMHVTPHGNASRPTFISNSERVRAARLLYNQPRDWVFQPEIPRVIEMPRVTEMPQVIPMPQVIEMPQVTEMSRPQRMAVHPAAYAQPMPSFHQAGD